MSFVTPTDGIPAVAEHVAQLTETLKGNRTIPLTLTGTLTVQTKAVAVSGTAGNTVVWNTDGFYVPTPAAGLTLPLTQHLTFSPDNTYDIGAAAATRPRTLYAATSVQTLVVESPSGFQNLALKPTNNLQFYTSGTWRWGMDSSALYPAFDNTLDIGLSGFRPKKTWVRDFDSNGTSTFPDLGADTPSAKFNGMVGFGGRVNIGGVAGADRIGWMVTGINTPSTTLMNGSTQTLWYAEYWSNDANTGSLNGMDFGCIGPPSVKVNEINLMRLRGVGARALGPNYARGLKVEQITNGTVDNIGVDIAAPGTTGSGSNLALRSQGPSELQGTTYIGNAKDGWFSRDGPSGEIRLYAQSQLRLSLGYGANYINVPGEIRIGNPVRGVIFTVAGTYPGLNLASFTGAIEISSAPPNPAQVTYNAWFDGTAWNRLATGPAATLQVTGSGIQFYAAPSAGAAVAPAMALMASVDTAGTATFQGSVNIAGQFAGQGFTHGYVVCPYSGWVIDGWSKLVIVSTPGWWVYLPNGTSKAGYYVTVKNWSGGVITIAASGGQVIGMPGGTSPTSIAINSGEAYTFMSDGGAGMMVISKAV